MVHLITVFVVSTLVANLLFQYRRLYRVAIQWIEILKNAIDFRSAKTMIEMSARYSAPVIVPYGSLRYVTVRSPEHMRIVLNSPYCQGKAMHYKFFRVSQGIFSSPAEIWKHERKVFNPCFGPALLPKFEGILNTKIVVFVQLLQKYVGEERNILLDIAQCFIDTIFTTAFGAQFDLQQTPDGRQSAEVQDEFVHLATKRVFSFWLWPEFIYRLTKAYCRERELLKYANYFVDRILLTNAENRKESNREGHKIFIDKLLELSETKEKHDIQYLRDHVITIILAGSDTSMTTVGNTLLMLAIHQDIQERVYQELMEVVGTDHNEPITQEDAAKLKYMEMVCKETMRLFPIAGIIGREATEDVVLDENTTIPSNSYVFLMFFQLHRDPQIWGPDADEFNPERFQPEVAAGRHPYAYLPFSGGPRMCLGMRYAWLSMKIMLGHVLRRYRLRTSLTMDTIEIDYSILMRIKQGCQILLEER